MSISRRIPRGVQRRMPRRIPRNIQKIRRIRIIFLQKVSSTGAPECEQRDVIFQFAVHTAIALHSIQQRVGEFS